MSSNAHTIVRRSAAALTLALMAAGCTLDKASGPAVSAPSGFGLSVSAVASPDTLPRDGQSTSTVRVTVRDPQDKPVAGQRLTVSATAGSLSASDVTTDASGTATVRFTAPAVTTAVASATVSATPVGADLGTVISGSKTVTIALAGPSVPTASFNFSPATPGQFDIVTFDATTTTLDGGNCLDVCTYGWDFGDGLSGSGRIASHPYTASGTYSVRLSVTAPGNVTVTSLRTVVVGAPATITPVITQSPTDAKLGDTIFFDASSSTTPDGTAIVSWNWDFGNGQVATTKVATTTYPLARTYTVRLTITDALGRTATTTKTVTVS